MSERILLCLAHMSGNEIAFIEEAFKDNWVVPLGPNVDGFEKDLENYLEGTSCPSKNTDKENNSEYSDTECYVAALSSGTAAVHLSLLACGVKPGDEVMVQSFTFCASSHPVTYIGAKPVFVDSERDTWNMDPDLLDKAIEDRIKVTGRKPKAIVVVHLYGMPAKMKELKKVARKWEIPIVEDAAEAFGSEYDCRRCGTLGQFGVLSFNGNKMITTSGGGAVVCRTPEEKKEIMFLATQARESYPYYQHEQIGYNYRMSNISAGIGRGQMTILEDHIAHPRHVQEKYREFLKDVEGITLHENPSPEFNSNFWLCTVTVDPELSVKDMEKAYTAGSSKVVGGVGAVTKEADSLHTLVEPNRNVEALRLALDKENIESRPLWKPMHLQPVYKDSPVYDNGVSEELFRTGLCLPAGPWVSDNDVEKIVRTIKNAVLSNKNV